MPDYRQQVIDSFVERDGWSFRGAKSSQPYRMYFEDTEVDGGRHEVGYVLLRVNPYTGWVRADLNVHNRLIWTRTYIADDFLTAGTTPRNVRTVTGVDLIAVGVAVGNEEDAITLHSGGPTAGWCAVVPPTSDHTIPADLNIGEWLNFPGNSDIADEWYSVTTVHRKSIGVTEETIFMSGPLPSGIGPANQPSMSQSEIDERGSAFVYERRDGSIIPQVGHDNPSVTRFDRYQYAESASGNARLIENLVRWHARRDPT